MTPIDSAAARRHRLGASSVIAVVSVLIAALMHTAMGGGTPSVVAAALALLASVAIGTLVVGARLTRRRAAAGVALDQAAFHALFAFFGPASIGAAAPSSAHPGHRMPALGLADPATAAAIAEAPAAAMIVGHLAAAVIAYGLVRRGVTAVASIIAALATAVAALFGPAAAAPPLMISPLRLAAPFGRIDSSTDALLRLPGRRGPPAHTGV